MPGPQVVVSVLGNIKGLTDSLDDAGKKTGSFGDKVASAGKKMTVFATVPIVGFLGAATKAAADDEQAQALLAKTLKNTTGATDDTVRAVEDQIGAFMKASTFSDDDLRPAYANLVRETRNVAESTALMQTAMDLAAAKGITVEEASMALVKAHNGQTKALAALGVETKNAEGQTASFASIMADTNKVVGGEAQAALDTTAGRSQQMRVRMGELTEKIGTDLLPVLTKLTDWLGKVVDWYDKLSPGVQTAILALAGLAAVIGPLITVVTALSTAMAFLAANPVVLIIAAIAALAAGLVIAYQKSETFRDVVNRVFELVGGAVMDAAGFVLDAVGRIIGAWATMAEAASHIPGIGDKFKGIAEDLRAAQGKVEGWADNMHAGLNLVTSDLERAKQAAANMEGALDGLRAKGAVIGVTMGAPGGRAVPHRQAGGPLGGGQVALVGERGPELFVPRTAGTVVSNGAAGGGGASIVANFYGPHDPAGVARQLEELLYRYQQQGGTLRFT